MRAQGITLVIVLGLLAMASQSFAQAGASRAVACDSKGAFHTVFTDSGKGLITHQVWQDGQWQGPTEVVQGYFPYSPVMALGPDDRLHLAWCDAGADSSCDIFYACFADGKWSQPVDLTEQQPGWDTNPRLCALPDGTVHVVWSEVSGSFKPNRGGFSSTGSSSGMHYRCLSDGQWSEPEIITEPGELPGALVPDGKGGLVLVYGIGIGPMGRAFTMRRQGAAWSQAETIPGIGGMSPHDSPAVAVDAEGNVHMVFSGTTMPDLMYCRQNEGAWGPAASLGRTMGVAHACLVRAPDGSVHLLRKAQVGFQGVLVHARYADKQWGEATVAFSNVFGDRGFMAVDPEGVVHVLNPSAGGTAHTWGKDGNWQTDKP